MKSNGRKHLLLATAAALSILTFLGGWYLFSTKYPPPSMALSQYVAEPPRFPVVFTSRSNAASHRAAADAGEQFSYPGKSLWQAAEGRLRLLLPNGNVSELTWGRPLADGTTIIDVISPSVSPDGKRIVFAGRKSEPDAGHFRLFEVNVDGTGLRQLTGGPNDSGCTQLPPMRYAEDGISVLSDSERTSVDYDDVDPTYAPGGHIVFASSRTPDLGRDHARRSTTIWIMREGGSDKKPLSANRNNDRWPWIAENGYVIFSLWSRNREVVSEDHRTIEPYQEGSQSGTLPTDAWLGAHIEPNGDYFGSVLKTKRPVWRPRRLFNGNYVFMTPHTDADDSPTVTILQARPGSVENSPSSLARGTQLPESNETFLMAGPTQSAEDRPLQLACPNPFPDNNIVLAAATPDEDGNWDDRRFGIYLASDQWNQNGSTETIGLTKLFDDPALVDSEPVAVYRREIQYNFQTLESGKGMATVTLADGETYTGPTARVYNSMVPRMNNDDAPGQQASDSNSSPIFNSPPDDLIEIIRVFASHRDRFDSPTEVRTPGHFEMLFEIPVEQGAFEFQIPPGSPTVLAGFDASGNVASWHSTATNASGKRAKFFAFAGDHYSGARPGFTHFCTGCHTGHSGTPTLRMPVNR